MYRFKGFVSIRTLASNGADTTAAVGELSAIAQTYAKDIKIYATSVNEVTVHGFSSRTDQAGNTSAPTVIIDTALSVASWIYMRQKGLSSEESKADFLSAFVSEFGSIYASISCGDMVLGSNSRSYPTYISWKANAYSADDNLNTLWFSDQAFRQQYDNYEIVVVPPILPLDSFFSSYAEVSAMLDARSWSQSLDVIQSLRAEYPETVLTAEEYNYVNPLNQSAKKLTNWSFLIYGPKGNDPDALKAALLDYIATNSARNISLWKTILPDVFRTTEFMIIPQWNKYAIAEMEIQSGIYSPISNLKEIVSFVKKTLPSYPPTHIDNYLAIMSHPYRSLMVGAIGNIENRDNMYGLAALFPDIISVSSTSLDFNRMSEPTKSFLLRLAEALYLAESATPYTTLPVTIRGAVRDNVFYVSFTYLNTRFFIATKYGINNL